MRGGVERGKAAGRSLHTLQLIQEVEARQTDAPGFAAVARMRESVQMLRRGNQDGARREFQRRASGLDNLANVMDQELLPHLRRVGFEV